MPVFKAEQLRQMCLAIFKGAGASEGEAERVVELLVESNLIGHDSHGVIRISGYVTQILSGKMNLGVEAKVVR
ncbi:MAG: Ldh family oxidoreductase, partial [Candidatus Bathyarchaeia archaeon]